MSAFDPKLTFMHSTMKAARRKTTPGGQVVTASVDREAVKQAGAAGAFQCVKAATA
jgi:hypothetical protein